ncbi:MAG: tetratricopeptide repeat protein [candidate division Zixibacteria bacterium]|nr:tetratricopeptide repeat protein [Candidatus Tariuqbacter arcticus]
MFSDSRFINNIEAFEIETPESYFNRGRQYYRKGNLGLAKKYLTLAQQSGYSNDELLPLMGFVYSEQGYLEEAEKFFKEALSKSPASAEARLGLGEVYFKKEKLLDAEDNFRLALSNDIDNGRAWNDMGMLYLKYGEQERAMVYFKNGTESGDEDARFNWGMLLSEQNRLAEAEDTLKPLLDSADYKWEVRLNLGYILLKKGNFDEALDYFNRAAETRKGNLKANYSAGLAFYYNQDYERAVASFERALAVNPNYFPAKNALAACSSRIIMTVGVEQDLNMDYAFTNMIAQVWINGMEKTQGFADEKDNPENPLISVIICAGKENAALKKCIDKCMELDYPKYEVLVLSDRKIDIHNKGVRVIPTGKVDSAVKRKIGAKEARGKMLAFLDDNSYPTKDWLKRNVEKFHHKST